jgi:glycosyltransferase involved in cell wall biosynthesis
VLVTHVEPPIHGQALMAATLAEQAAGWTDARLVVVNTVYAEERDRLARFGLRKVGRMLRYVAVSVRETRRTRAALVVVTPSFYRGPFLKDAVMILALRWLARTRVVAWVNMDPARLDLERRPAWYRAVVRLVVRSVDSWVASAPALLGQWPSFIPVERRSAIAYGIHGAPPSVQRVTEGEHARRVCFLSSLDEAKGWVDLLEAAGEVCVSDPTVEFHFYGDVGVGETEERILERFGATGFPERIRWHGPARGDAKWESLAAADVFCLPSHTEQFPVVVLEAMSVGLPVVATRVGAVEDAVVEGKGGWLVPPERPHELARALLEALSDQERLERYGQFNAERQRRAFSVEPFGHEWERFLSRAAAEAES